MHCASNKVNCWLWMCKVIESTHCLRLNYVLLKVRSLTFCQMSEWKIWLFLKVPFIVNGFCNHVFDFYNFQFAQGGSFTEITFYYTRCMKFVRGWLRTPITGIPYPGIYVVQNHVQWLGASSLFPVGNEHQLHKSLIPGYMQQTLLRKVEK